MMLRLCAAASCVCNPTVIENLYNYGYKWLFGG